MSDNKSINPICWVPTVYFAMGLPFVALSMVSVLMFSDMGVSNAQIAFWTSLIMLPWTLKPLWSPFLEMFKTFCRCYPNGDGGGFRFGRTVIAAT